MCGITGYVGARSAEEILLGGLDKLAYRGYDSAGLALAGDAGEVETLHAVGNLQALRERAAARHEAVSAGGLAVATRPARLGIGHTRWATHGRVSQDNAHPHADEHGRVQLVLNGIVENFSPLKTALMADDVAFSSQTDAEVVAHLIARHLENDLPAAVRAAYAQLEGHFSFVVLSPEHPGLLVAARRECPLVIGRGEGEQFLASSVQAFAEHTQAIQLVEDHEIVTATAEGVELQTAAGVKVTRPVTLAEVDEDAVELGSYDTYMLKEIHEQPQSVARTLAGRISPDGAIDLGLSGTIDDAQLREVRRIVVIACGTSHHAGLIGRYAIEEWARVPVEIDVASEFRYRNPVVGPGDLVVGISQSGETADTLAAMRLARRRGATVLAVTNVAGSQMTREADGVLLTHAGVEIGVAATKTFVCQVAVMYLLGLKLAALRGALPVARHAGLAGELERLPERIARTIRTSAGPAAALAEVHGGAEFFLYLGRHVGLPVALEGALKLKEVSYVPTDAYAAGEMKHGPIALLSEATPVVCVATEAPVLTKVLSNVAEVQTRGAHVIAIATEGDRVVAELAPDVIEVPRTDWLLQPLVAIVPLQLLAYEIARGRGLNVDQPRNLAKTVTVE